MDPITIGGAIASANSAISLIRSSLGAQVKLEVNTAITVLNDALRVASQEALLLQEKVVTLQREKAELENEVARIKRTKDEIKDYRLRDVEQGAFVYAYEPAVQATEGDAQPAKPPHWLCVPCVDNGFMSVLQFAEGNKDIYQHVFHRCPRCKAAISVNIDNSPAGKKTRQTYL